jgi:hypothetical protein
MVAVTLLDIVFRRHMVCIRRSTVYGCSLDTVGYTPAGNRNRHCPCCSLIFKTAMRQNNAFRDFILF